MSPQDCATNFNIDIVDSYGTGHHYSADYTTNTKPWVSKSLNDTGNQYDGYNVYSFGITADNIALSNSGPFTPKSSWTITPLMTNGSTLTSNPANYTLTGGTKYDCDKEPGEGSVGFNMSPSILNRK